MKPEEFIEVALEYRDEWGFSFFPIEVKKKVPLIKWKEYQSRYPTDDEIEYWSTLADDLNLAIVTGEISGITVVDIDDEEGYKALMEHDVPETQVVHSRRGEHMYFNYCDNEDVKTLADIFPSVDIRNNGGYVVAPPSIHKSGHIYEWNDKNAERKDFPTFIIDRFEEIKQEKQKNRKNNGGKDKGKPISERLTEGKRNSTLISVAGWLRGAGFSEGAIQQALEIENSNSANPLSDSEVATVVKSACRYPIAPTTYPLTDSGNMERFVDRYGDRVCYNIDRGKWLYYNNKVWMADKSEMQVQDRVLTMVRSIPNEVDRDNDEEGKRYETYQKWAKASESSSRINNTINMSKRALGIGDTEFDSNEFIFNLANGAIELDKNNIREHRKNDYLTHISPVEFDRSKDCPTWKKFLNEIFLGDDGLIEYIQRAVGYSMTSSTIEQVFFILHGSGQNGKSVFLDTLQYIMGDYGKSAGFKTFLEERGGSTASSDLARLKGARIVTASESDEGRRLKSAQIKNIVGDKSVTARFLHQDEFEFTPTFKIWLATNHLPDVRDHSKGMWRRLRYIPFNYTVPDDKRDDNLYSKLVEESSGILNWCLEGFRKWKKEGLGTCDTVMKYTNKYKASTDILGMFLKERVEETSTDDYIKMSDMYEVYTEWCNESGHRPLGKIKFNRKLEGERGFARSIKGGGYNSWLGVSLKSHSPTTEYKGMEVKDY